MSNSPNIIYILADDMGYGDVGCYNPSSKIPTPNMDFLASQGMCFTNTHSPSAVCTPTRYGLMTGRYCWRSNLQEGVLYNYELPLIEPDRVTLPSMLRNKGYYSACIGKWHLGLGWKEKEGEQFSLFQNRLPWPSPPPSPEEEEKIDFKADISGGPIDLGFDEFFGTSGCATAQPPYGFIQGNRMTEIPTVRKGDQEKGGRDGLMVPGWKHKNVDPLFTRKAVHFIEERAREPSVPFFLYLSASSPHEPCIESAVPEFARGVSEAGPRGDMVWLFDWMVGEIMDALERTGMANNTLVVVTSDNGAMPGCLGRTYGHTSCGSWRGYKGYIWDGGHREPFIMRWPQVIEPKSKSSQLVGLQDFMATIAEALDIRLPKNSSDDSISFLSTLKGQVSNKIGRSSLVHHSSLGVFALRSTSFDEDWKLIVDCVNSGDNGRGVDGGMGNGPVPGSPGQLYRMDNDSGEIYNLYDNFPEVVQRLNDQLEGIKVAEKTML